MTFDETFPLQYYINLGRREDRRREAMNGFLDAGLENVQRWPAVDARRVKNARGNQSAGRYALALTDRLILREAVRQKADAVMIFEDDVVLHPEFQERWAELELPDDWGIFYLGCQHVQMPQPCGGGLQPPSPEKDGDVRKLNFTGEGFEPEGFSAGGLEARATPAGIVRVTRALDTQAFAVRRKYYQQVISALKGCTKGHPWKVPPSDQLLARLAETVPMYAAYPNLAWQRVSESDLVGKNYSSYHPTGEQRASWHIMEGFSSVYHGGNVWSGRALLSTAEILGKEKPTRPLSAEESMENARDKEMALNLDRSRFQGKVAFLFLTVGDLTQPEVWSEYFQGNEAMCTRYAHVKHPEKVTTDWLKASIISERIETQWGKISLVQASLALLQQALEDKKNEWFVLASESCAPIKPFKQLRRELRFDPRTRLSWETHAELITRHPQKAHRADKLRSIPPMYIRFHPQWWLFNREAAEAVTQDDFTAHFSDTFAPDEMYFGTVLRMKGYPVDERVSRKHITQVRWIGGDGPHPFTYERITLAEAAELATSDSFLGRKFSPKANLREWGLHVD